MTQREGKKIKNLSGQHGIDLNVLKPCVMLKMKKKDKEKINANILGQHERDLNVLMPCIIPKRKTLDKE
jgi:hypothetical protein